MTQAATAAAQTLLINLLRDLPSFDQDVRVAAGAVEEVDADQPVWRFRNHAGCRERRQIPAGRQDHRVARATEATIEDEVVALESIAFRRRVRFRDSQAHGL